MSRQQYLIDGNLFIPGYVPDASIADDNEWIVEPVQEVAEHTFISPLRLVRERRNVTELSRPENPGAVHKLYNVLAQRRQQILERYDNHAEKQNDGYRPWLAKFALHQAEALDTKWVENERAPRPIVGRHDFDDTHLSVELRALPGAADEVFLNMQRVIKTSDPPRMDYFIINNGLRNLRINGYAIVNDTAIVGPLPDFSIIEAEDDVVFWWRTERAFNPRPDPSSSVPIKREHPGESGETKQPPRKKRAKAAEIGSCQDKLVRNLDNLRAGRDKYKRAVIRRGDAPSPPPTPEPVSSTPPEQPPPVQSPVKPTQPEQPPPVPSPVKPTPPEHPPTVPSPVRSKTPDLPTPVAPTIPHPAPDPGADQIYESLPVAEIDRGQWMDAFMRSLEQMPRPSPPNGDYTSPRVPFVKPQAMTLGQVYLAVASFLVPLNGTTGDIAFGAATIRSGENELLDCSVPMPCDHSNMLFFLTKEIETRSDVTGEAEGGHASESFGLVAVRELTPEDLHFFNYDSYRFKKDRTRILGAVQQKMPCEGANETEAKTMQDRDPSNSGVHTVLTVWALMLSITLSNRDLRIDPAHAKETYDMAFRLINFAIQGRLEAFTVELFLYTYGFAERPATFDGWSKDREKGILGQNANQRNLCSMQMNRKVLMRHCCDVKGLEFSKKRSEEDLLLPELPGAPCRASQHQEEQPSSKQALKISSVSNIMFDYVAIAIGSLWKTLVDAPSGKMFSFSDSTSFHLMATGEYAQNSTYVGESDTFIIPVYIGEGPGKWARHGCSDVHATNFWQWQVDATSHDWINAGNEAYLDENYPDWRTQPQDEPAPPPPAEGEAYGGIGHTILAVARRVSAPSHNVEVTVFDSMREFFDEYTELYISNVIKNSGWMESEEPRFAPTQLIRTIKQSSAKNTRNACGLHTIFNAWAILLGLQPGQTPKVLIDYKDKGDDSEVVKDFYSEGLKLVNRALKGEVDIRSIRKFLLCTGIADEPMNSDPAVDPSALDDLNTSVMSEDILRDFVNLYRTDLIEQRHAEIMYGNLD